jgi:hypothetical protein
VSPVYCLREQVGEENQEHAAQTETNIHYSVRSKQPQQKSGFGGGTGAVQASES